jgi:putrescine transport system substrate-binding protein
MLCSNLKNRVGLIGVLLSTALLALGMPSLSVASEDKVLNIYNWSDYIGDDTIKNFEKETGIKVHYDTFDSNETLHAKLVAGRTGYDIVVPSSNWAKIQLEGGLFMRLDKSKITTYGNLDPYVMKNLATMDPGNQYLVPWMWGITTVGINVDKVKAALGNLPMPDNAWDLLFKPEYISKLKSCGVSQRCVTSASRPTAFIPLIIRMRPGFLRRSVHTSPCFHRPATSMIWPVERYAFRSAGMGT